MKTEDINKLPPIGDAAENGCFSLYIAGWKPSEIEQEAGVNGNTLRSWIMRGKWAEKKADIDALRLKRNPPLSQPLIRAVVKADKGALREKYLELAGVAALENMEHISTKMKPAERLESATNIAAIGKHDRDQLGLSKDDASSERSLISLTFLTNPGVRILDETKVKEIEHYAESPTSES